VAISVNSRNYFDSLANQYVLSLTFCSLTTSVGCISH